jgi:hypothetical protein
MAGNEIFEHPQAIEAPESGGYSGKDVIQRIFQVPKELVGELIPDHGLLSPLGDGYHDESRLSIMNGPSYAKVVLSYVKSLETPSGSTAQRKDGGEEYSLEINYIEKPLETHPNYLTKWNYDLYQAGLTDAAISPTIPSWANTATDQSDTLGFSDSTTNYRWAKNQPPNFQYKSKEYTWVKAKNRTKPGIEAYVYPQPVVVIRKYYKKLQSAIDVMASVPAGTKAVPAEQFGYDSDKDHWLYEPQGIYQDSGWWVLAGRFLYVDNKWDNDIYGS